MPDCTQHEYDSDTGPDERDWTPIPEESGQEDDDSSDAMIVTVLALREMTADEPGLRDAHSAAVRLGEHVFARRLGTGQEAADFLPVLSAARKVAAELDKAVLASDDRERFDLEITRLAWQLGEKLGDAIEFDRRTVPIWLDVASPAHGRINVMGERSRFAPNHVVTETATTVVTANDCTLEAVDHYHLRRVSLDCESLYSNGPAVKAFVALLLDPSARNRAELRERLSEIVHTAAEVGGQTHHQKLSPQADTLANQPDVVFLGDRSTICSTTRYHVRETIFPLADLLYHQPALIDDLVNEYLYGTPARHIRSALADVEDADLLHHSHELDDGQVSVTRSAFGVRVGLASAVMIGYGNRLVARSAVDVGTTEDGNLSRFDEIIRMQIDAALVAHRPRPHGRFPLAPPEPPPSPVPSDHPYVPESPSVSPPNPGHRHPGIGGFH
ncbi:hypothetical protein [Actinoplanes sp. NBRC 103695]|uniref:hypothetical protein n=1 Tax=Actinoplanes sp. NBRC 103695 TaxID=3032202 RepID=UPI0025574121|nr:hypothetical protein [Actinoplanes sp. NBRC 103695]